MSRYDCKRCGAYEGDIKDHSCVEHLRAEVARLTRERDAANGVIKVLEDLRAIFVDDYPAKPINAALDMFKILKDGDS